MAQGWVTGRKLRRRLVGVLGSLPGLVTVAGCGYWRPFSDAVVGTGQGSVVVLEFGGPGTGDTGQILVAWDDGLHWQVSHAFPTPTDPSRMPGLSLRTEDCVPGAPEHCYRVVSGHALVQKTRDAGRHWFTAWQLSAGRELFLRRSGGYLGAEGVLLH
ncbi:hypothetical protein [Streptacidiphilus sp. MAP12-33]|uniref:hypothetical protein n=1 Tax=Streptacidiphilus sp. MAP12-33 TaxID=3156266 RepID=UPI00351999F1